MRNFRIQKTDNLKQIRIQLIFLALILMVGLKGSAQNITWENFIGGTVDAKGVVFENQQAWIGARQGLIKYNKQTGEKQFYHSGNSGIPDNDFTNDILTIAIDQSGNKWMGTFGAGIIKYDGQSWEFYNSDNSALANRAQVISTIKANGNQVWFGTFSGVYHYNGSKIVSDTQNFTHRIIDLAIDQNDNVWASTGFKGVGKYDGQAWKIFDKNNSPLSNDVSNISIDLNGNIWFADEGNNAVKKYDGQNWQNFNGSNSALPDKQNLRFKDLEVDKNGNVWVYIKDENLMKYNGSQWESLKQPKPGLITVDQQNVKWTLNDSTLVEYDGSQIQKHSLSLSDLPFLGVGEVAANKNGTIWCGKDGIASYDGNQWKNYNNTNMDKLKNSIRAMETDQDTGLWISLEQEGLVRLKNGNLKTFSNLSFSSDNIGNMAFRGNNKWFTIRNGGAAYYDGTSWDVFDNTNSNIPTERITSVSIENPSSIWFGSFDKGVVHFKNGQWQSHSKGTSNLPSNRILDVAVDTQGNVWAATRDSGLTKYDGNQWHVFNSDNSNLPQNEISKLLVDGNNNLWIGLSYKGIARYKQGDWNHYYTGNSGIADNSIQDIAMLNEKDLVLANSTGITIMDRPNDNDNSAGKPEKSAFKSKVKIIPNPFKAKTKFQYHLSKSYEKLSLTIYNASGQKVKDLGQIEEKEGKHTIQLDMLNLPNGIYHYRLSGEGQLLKTGKLLKIK